LWQSRIFTENLTIGRIEYKFAEHQLGEGCSFRHAPFAPLKLGVVRKQIKSMDAISIFEHINDNLKELGVDEIRELIRPLMKGVSVEAPIIPAVKTWVSGLHS